MIRVLVTGGRNFNDKNMVFEALDYFHETYGVSELVHGGANGADSIAGLWAESKNIPVQVFFPEWDRYGKRAGPLRNLIMLKTQPNILIAFPGGKGTSHMVRNARSQGVKVMKIEQQTISDIRLAEKKLEKLKSHPDTSPEELIDSCHTIFGENCDLEIAFKILNDFGIPVYDIIDRTRKEYLVVFEKGDTSYGAYVPDLPACIAVADSLEETVKLIRSGIEFHIEGLIQDKDPVPEPITKEVELEENEFSEMIEVSLIDTKEN